MHRNANDLLCYSDFYFYVTQFHCINIDLPPTSVYNQGKNQRARDISRAADNISTQDPGLI